MGGGGGVGRGRVERARKGLGRSVIKGVGAEEGEREGLVVKYGARGRREREECVEGLKEGMCWGRL